MASWRKLATSICLKLRLRPGQRVIATVDAEKLFSHRRRNLQILDAQGFVLVENLDHVGLDPYLESQPRMMESFTFVCSVFRLHPIL